MRVGEFLVLAVAMGMIAFGSPARAQGDDAFGQCLTAHTTAADRAALIRWVFVGMAGSAAVRDLADVPTPKRVETIRNAAAIVERLLIRDCRAEAVGRFKANPNAMQQSFGRLGQQAVQDLMRDPAVVATFAGIVRYVDMGAMAKLMLDAGLNRR